MVELELEVEVGSWGYLRGEVVQLLLQLLAVLLLLLPPPGLLVGLPLPRQLPPHHPTEQGGEPLEHVHIPWAEPLCPDLVAELDRSQCPPPVVP